MEAELKAMHSPEVLDLKNFSPVERDNFMFLLQFLIGPKGGNGYESFDVIVCTPRWLLENQKAEDVVLDFHHLVVFKYDYNKIHEKAKEFVSSFRGESWDEVTNQLRKFWRWEFEDYRSHKI